MRLLDRKLKKVGLQEWTTADGRVRVELRHSWRYLGGGRSASTPAYFITLDGRGAGPLTPPRKPTEVLALVEALRRRSP